MNESRMPRLIAGVLLAVLVVAGFLYYRYTTIRPQPAPRPLIPNWYRQVKEGEWSQDLKSAEELRRANRPIEAIQVLENVRSKITDAGQKSVVDLDIASIHFFDIDRERGAALFAAVATTTEYPAMSRAYAMLKVADQFDGLQDKNLLKPFFKPEEFAAKDGAALVYALYRRTYETYPFGLAAGKLAIRHIRETSKDGIIPDQDYAMVLKYVADIDRNLVQLEKTDAFKRFIPVTLLIKANLYRRLEDVERPIGQPIDDVYLLAIARARTFGISSTEQFSVFYYTDYLAKQKKKDQVIKLLSESLSSSTLDPMVKNFLKSKSSVQAKFPYLYELLQQDPDVNAAYTRVAA